MAQYSPLAEESVYDIAVKLYGDAALGVQILLSQNEIDLDVNSIFGTDLSYTLGATRTKPVYPVIEIFRPEEPYTTLYLQSAYDLAIQLYGDVSKIGNIINYFPNLDNEIPIGSLINVAKQDDPIAAYFADRRIAVATVPPPIPPFLFDPDYQAILDYGTLMGFTLPSEEQKLLQNQFVIDLKSIGVWVMLDILYVFATDGDENFAKINWVSPGDFIPLENGTVAFTVNEGLQGNGTNGYLNNGYIPSTHAVNYLANDASVFCWINNNVSETRFDFGVNGGISDPSTILISRTASNIYNWRINFPGQLGGASTNSIGFHHVQKRATNARILKNGSQVSTSNVIASGVPTRFMPIFANNNNGSIGSYSSRQMSIFGLGASLDGMETVLYNAWDDYFTNL